MSGAHVARSRRLWPTLAISAVIALLAAVLVPISAQANSITLSGIVSNQKGVALKGVSISAVKMSDGSTVAGCVSSSTGAFAFAPLAAGTYTLRFAATPTTFDQYLGNTSDFSNAVPISLDAGAGNLFFLKPSLSLSGTATGTVKQTSGAGLAKYTVRAYSQDGFGNWSVVKSGLTSTSGSYSLTGLEPGEFRLEAVDATNPLPLFAPAFSGGVTSVTSATSIGVTAGGTTSYNFVLGKSGKVSGTVTGLNPGVVPVASTRVIAYRLAGTPGSWTDAQSVPFATAVTKANGGYSIAGLTPGYYTLEFVPPTSPVVPPGFGRTFLGLQDQAINATYFRIVNGNSIAGENIQLEQAAAVHGEVLKYEDIPTQTPLPNVRITIDRVGANPDQPSSFAQSTITDVNGAYSFSGLGSGAWEFIIGSNTDSNPNDGISEDTTRQREIVPLFGGPLSPGVDQLERPTVELKDTLGLYATGAPTIVGGGAAQVGFSLAVNPGVWSALINPSDFRYQWFRSTDNSTWVPIVGAKDQSYVPTSGDYQNYLRARVTVGNFAYGAGVPATTAATVQVALGSQLQQSGGGVLGTFKVGKTLTADPGTWFPGGVLLSYQWQSSLDGSTWTDIPSEIGSTLTIVPGEVGLQLRVNVHGTRLGYAPATVTMFGGPVFLGDMTSIVAPKVTKSATAFAVTNGTWSPVPSQVHSHWQTYAANGNPSTSVTDANLPIAGTAGEFVTVYVTTDLLGYNTGTSNLIVVQTGSAPTFSGPTSISGSATIDSVLSAPSDTWTNPNGTTTYQWKFKSGATWKSIAGATLSTYSVLPADLGRTIRVDLTRTTTGFAVGHFSTDALGPIAKGAAPVNSGTPASISGTVAEYATVTADPGVWTPTPTSFGFQWKRSSDGGATYTSIAGATHATYSIAGGLKDQLLRVVVTANRVGHPAGTVNVDEGDIAGGIKATVLPQVTKTGPTTYAVSSGTWAPNTVGLTYTWYTFDSSDVLAGPIGGSDPTQDLASFALHLPVVVFVMASQGPYVPTTLEIPVKKGDLNPNSYQPTLSDGLVGTVFTPGVIFWGPNTVALSYQWEWSANGSTNWAPITGAVGSTYTPTNATYAGKFIRVKETATHANYNPGVGYSVAAAVVAAPAPTPGSGGAAPQVTGPNIIGGTLTAVPGTWSVGGLTFGYQWQESPDGIASYTDIVGATHSTYLIPESKLGQHFKLILTANHSGYGSASTVVVVGGAAGQGNINSVKVPSVTKSASGKLTVSTGTWSIAPTSFSYEWDVLDPSNDVPTIVGTNSKSYTPQPADAGKLIRVTVVPLRTHYSGSAIDVVARLATKISAVTDSAISGVSTVGASLFAHLGSWSTFSPSVDFQWYRNGVKLPGQTASSYAQVGADLGKKLSVRLTVSKTGYPSLVLTLTAPTTLSTVVPSATTQPVISGTAKVDSVLTANPGTWSLSGLSFTYQWTRQDVPILGATSSTYLVSALDLNDDVAVIVTSHKTNYSPGQAKSDPMTVAEGDFLSLTSPIVIHGTGALGSILTTTGGTWNFPSTVTYMWSYHHVNPGWIQITGAYSNSYIPSAADGVSPGDLVMVNIYATRPGHSGGGDSANILIIP